MQVSHGTLEPNPVGQAITRRHVEDLKLTFAAALEARGVTFVLGPDCFGTLARPSLWSEEGGGGMASDNLTEWGGLATHVGTRNLVTLLHELLEIVLIVVHSVSPPKYACVMCLLMASITHCILNGAVFVDLNV